MINDPMDIDFGDDEEPAKPAAPAPEPVPEEKPQDAPPPQRRSTLLIIRHGNTFGPTEAPRRIGGKTDLPLTAEGRAQIVKLRQHLTERGLMPTRVVSGPLQRTAQTAALLGIKFEAVEFLREINHGMDENKPEEQVIRNVGAAALKAWDEESRLPPGWSADILGIRQGWLGLKKIARDGGVMAAVTSNGIARFSLEGIDNAPVNRKLSTGAYGVLVWNGEKWICDGWNVRP